VKYGMNGMKGEVMTDNCSGCTVKRGDPSGCMGYNGDSSCPCTLCVVKTMCHKQCKYWERWHYLKMKGE